MESEPMNNTTIGPDRHPQAPVAAKMEGALFLDNYAVPLTALLIVGVLFWVFKR